MAVPHRAPAQAVGRDGTGRVPPVAYVLVAISSVQLGAGLAVTLFDDVGALGTSLLRLGLAGVIIAAVVRPRLRSRSAADLRLALAFGLALGAMNISFYAGLDRVPLGPAVTIEFVGPLGVAVALSRRRLDLLWAALAAAGILALTNPFGAGGLDALGVLLVLVAGGCWAAYILLAAHAGPRFDGLEGVALALIVAGLLAVVPGVLDGGTRLLHPGLIALGACVALLSSIIPYSAETEALRRIPRNVFGVLMSLEPAVAAIVGFVVLGQDLAAREILAIGLVVVASVGALRSSVPPVEA